jgi:hypothetical protein
MRATKGSSAGSGSGDNKVRRTSEKRLTHVRQDISSGTNQLETWVKRVEDVDIEIRSLGTDSNNKPILIKLESDRTYYQSKVDRILKRLTSSQRKLSEYIGKNQKLDDESFGIE